MSDRSVLECLKAVEAEYDERRTGWFLVLGIMVAMCAPAMLALSLAIMWGWFVMPITGWASLGPFQAIGLALTVRLVVGDHREKKLSLSDHAGRIFVGYPVTVGFGWIIKQLI